MSVYIKTKMGTMPKCCLDCEAMVHRKDMVKYTRHPDEVYESCSARKLGVFQPLTRMSCGGIDFEKSRPEWCPLVAMEETADE